MIELDHLRDLDLCEPPTPGRAAHLSAASGLVVLGQQLVVIADDEHHLGVFSRHTRAPGALVRILSGDLPSGSRARKKRKKDFEALVRLPPFVGYPAGALCGLGSGSKTGRCTAVLLAVTTDARIEPAVRTVDLGAWYARLAAEIDGLNIEGAIVAGSRLRLLQRGNKGAAVSAVIDLDLAAFVAALTSDIAGLLAAPLTISRCDLGEVGGIPYGFTDGAALPDGRVLFTAVAEDTEDPVQDGACAGAAVGVLDRHARILCLERVQSPWKLEGVAVTAAGTDIAFLAVTDADDAAVPAALLRGELAW